MSKKGKLFSERVFKGKLRTKYCLSKQVQPTLDINESCPWVKMNLFKRSHGLEPALTCTYLSFG